MEAKRAEAEAGVLRRIAELRPGTTDCPSLVAHAVLGELGIASASERDSLALLRSLLIDLREKKRLRFYQKGVVVPLTHYPRGAFRLGK